MNLIHNERIKLRANAFDRLSTAFVAVGVLGQVLAWNPAGGLSFKLLSIATWIFGASGPHWMADQALRKLK